jgi:hypothetical protein
MVVLLAGGIGLVLMGLLALGFGIQDKEFEVGKTLILVGTIVSCTGFIVLSLLVAVRELRAAFGAGSTAHIPTQAYTEDDHHSAVENRQDEPQPASDGFPFSRSEPAANTVPRPVAADAPWQQEVEARRAVERPSAAAPAPPVVDPSEPKPRRNLLFSSTSRRERERAAGKTAEVGEAPPPFAEQAPAPRAPEPAPRPPVPEPAPPATFDDAWPQPERATPRRPSRTPSTYEPPAAAAAPVTVLKSGIVDGMAYSLYSDGSIEAQLEEGMMRFGSIDELRTHLDQRA